MPRIRAKGTAAAAAATLMVLSTAAPAAGDDFYATDCRYDAATRTVTVHLASNHVVKLDTRERRIYFTDLHAYSSRKGFCGSATTRNTDRIKVTEGHPGQSRLQIDFTWGRFMPGYTTESDGYSEIEFDLGTVTQLWVLGRPVADRVVLGADGFSFTADGDADGVGPALREVSVFAGDGNDFVSARGGYGTGAVWSGPAGVGLAAYGGEGDDRLYGAAGRDILMGDGGSDRLYGSGGADDLDGGTGSDLIYGHGGKDYIRGGYWSDKIWAGPGDDFIDADDATADEIDGGTGNDVADIDSEDTIVNVESTR